MTGSGAKALSGSLVLFIAYFGNVTLGAFGGGAILGDVGEMLMLFASVILFVIGVLAREAAAKEKAAK